MKDHHLNTFIKFSFNKHLHSSIFNRYFIKLYSKCQNVHEYLPMVVITMVDTHSIRSTKRRKLREEREGEEKIRTRKLEVLIGELDSRRIHPLAPVSTRSLAGYCDKRITRSCENVYAWRVWKKTRDIKLNPEAVFSICRMPTSPETASKMLQRAYFLPSTSTVAFLFPSSFFLSFHLFRRKIQIVLPIKDFWLFLLIAYTHRD